MFRHENFLSLVEIPNGVEARSISLGIFHLDDIGLYMLTTEQLAIFIRAAKLCEGPE